MRPADAGIDMAPDAMSDAMSDVGSDSMLSGLDSGTSDAASDGTEAPSTDAALSDAALIDAALIDAALIDATLIDATLSDATLSETGTPDGSAPLRRYDVVVVGAGTSGVGAAIQAARMGASVALLEPTDWIGGQATAAGVSSMDETSSEGGSGIYAEFITNVAALYKKQGKSISTCYWSGISHCFEPSVGEQVLHAMIDDTRSGGDGGAARVLDLYLRTKVASVLKNGSTVVGVVTADSTRFDAQVVIDATEFGDLLPLAGAAYRVGNSTSDAIDPTSCIQDITYTAIMKKYPGGVPAPLVIANPPPGYSTEQPYFALMVATNGQTWATGKYPVDFITHNAYRGTPDSTNPQSYTAGDRTSASLITKTGVNLANDYPGQAAYDRADAGNPTLPVAYLEDPTYRQQVNCEAKLRTLQFLYYVQHDLNEPLWSVAQDEGYGATDYNQTENDCPNIPAELKALERSMPVIPYVRESRRLMGVYALTAKDISRSGNPPVPAKTFPDAIALGGYGDDIHNCDSNAELDLGDVRADGSGKGPFQVPFQSFIPQTVDGFLPAEKNISISRMASGATRLQPSTMLVGQAAGTVAALAIARGIEVRALPPVLAQDALIRANVRLSVYEFTDVPRSDPLWPSVELVTTREIMSGTGTGLFGPGGALSRAATAEALVKVFALPINPPATPTFQDVPTTHPAYPYVEAFAAAGITTGCSTTPPLFCPDAPTSRTSLAVFIARGAKLDVTLVPATPLYSDVPATTPFFKYIQAVGVAKLIPDCGAAPRTFCPMQPATRGVVAEVSRNTLLWGR